MTWAGAASADRAWHAGLNLRSELGTHPIRAGGGVQLDRLELTLVLDPMWWTDGQHDIDAVMGWRVDDRGLGLFAGWRNTSLGLSGGRHYQEKLLLGVSSPMDAISTSWFAATWGFEVSTVVAKHGADLPTEWISFETGRDFIDLVNFAMFVRFDYAAGF